MNVFLRMERETQQQCDCCGKNTKNFYVIDTKDGITKVGIDCAYNLISYNKINSVTKEFKRKMKLDDLIEKYKKGVLTSEYIWQKHGITIENHT